MHTDATFGDRSLFPSLTARAYLAHAAISPPSVLVERALPAKAKKYFPSATGLGLAFTLPFSNAISMFLGALVALALEKKYSREQAERWLIPISSGLIAGESLMEIVVRVLQNFHLLAE